MTALSLVALGAYFSAGVLCVKMMKANMFRGMYRERLHDLW